jgi:hypothetical protein
MRRAPFTRSKITGAHFCQRLSRPQGHSAAGRIRPIKKCNKLVGNRTGDLTACSIVPQPTRLPRAPALYTTDARIQINNYVVIYEDTVFTRLTHKAMTVSNIFLTKMSKKMYFRRKVTRNLFTSVLP